MGLLIVLIEMAVKNRNFCKLRVILILIIISTKYLSVDIKSIKL